MAKRKCSHQKPVGEQGPLVVGRVEGEIQASYVTWLKIKFPNDKESQQKLIATVFLDALGASEGNVWNCEALREDDFDFSITCNAERRYLELQEIVIPPKKRGNPYIDREQVVQSGKFADTIWSNILQKQYPTRLELPLDLLIYTTHWRFLPNQIVRQLVASMLKSHSHPFARVYEFSMLSEGKGRFETLYPNDQLLLGLNEAAARTVRYANLDQAQARQTGGPDGSIGARIDLTPSTVKRLFGNER